MTPAESLVFFSWPFSSFAHHPGGTPQSGRTIETLGLSKLSKEEIMDFVLTGTHKVSPVKS
ncbi:hypothetical protein AAEY33_25185 [Peribacillus simplex]|jgi:hypothetical protein|uniref:hypothetical protein n=1 Tax=Peribacillus simplex TaxID=1478 RepID=UPI0032657505